MNILNKKEDIEKLILKVTADGSTTFFVPELNEQYHSMNGAVIEAEHVYIKNGLLFHQSDNLIILEIGFGTGLNCFLTALQTLKQQRKIYYISIDNYPISEKLISLLNYQTLFSKEEGLLFPKIHNAPWGTPTQITDSFTLLKIESDLTKETWTTPERCDVVYFDAFGPDKQPEMWSRSNFSKIFKLMKPNGVVVTYSSKGEVRRRMESAGFRVEKVAGPPGKKEMLRGIKV